MKKNFAYNLIYQALQIVLPLILTPYIARVLGAENLGIYNYSYTIASFFLLFAMLGVTNYGSRSIAKVQDEREKRSQLFCGIHLTQIIASFIALLIYITYVFITVPSVTKTISVIQIAVVFSAMIDINWFYFGVENFKLTVTRNIIIKILTFVCALIFVKDKSDLALYAVIMTSGILIGQLIMWITIRKYVDFKKVHFSIVKQHIKPMLLLFVPIIAVSLYKYMDKIMLGYLSTYSQVAFYSNSELIVGVPAIITTALGTVGLPRLSNLVAKGQTELSEYYISVSLEFAMFLACGMGFGIAALSDYFVYFYYGEEYLECIPILVLLTPSIVFQAWASIIRMQFLLPNSFDKVYVKSVYIGALVNLIFNLIFIPQFEAMGAAIGTIAAELTVAVIQTKFSATYLPIRQYIFHSVFYFVDGILMFILLKVGLKILERTLLNMMILVLVGSMFYVLFAILFNKNNRNRVFFHS